MMFSVLFKAFITLLSIGAVVGLALYEAKTGQDINIVAYYILAGVVFGLQSEQVMKIIDSFRNLGYNRSEGKTNLEKDTEKQSS